MMDLYQISEVALEQNRREFKQSAYLPDGCADAYNRVDSCKKEIAKLLGECDLADPTAFGLLDAAAEREFRAWDRALGNYYRYSMLEGGGAPTDSGYYEIKGHTGTWKAFQDCLGAWRRGNDKAGKMEGDHGS
jgi:hypothetical protein